MTTSLRRFLSTVAVLAVVGGILLLALPVSAVTGGGKTVSCGTAFEPNTSQAGVDHFGETVGNAFAGRPYASNGFDGYAARCDDAIDTRRGWGYPLGALGILLAVGIGVVSSRQQEDTTADDTSVTPEA